MNVTIGLGDHIPCQMVRRVGAAGAEQVDTCKWLGDGTTILFTVPGAFTPTCHNDHLPGYVSAAKEFALAGANRIVCAAANDHHVLLAWGQNRDALGAIEFMADFDASFARAMGLAKDLSGGGLGWRFVRSAMIIRDGTVEKLFVDEKPGLLTNTSASAILSVLQGHETLSVA